MYVVRQFAKVIVAAGFVEHSFAVVEFNHVAIANEAVIAVCIQVELSFMFEEEPLLFLMIDYSHSGFT